MENKDEILKQIEVLQLLNAEISERYPKRSSITFSTKHPAKEGEDERAGLFYCNWYDKQGEGFPLKNIVSKPMEWQGITIDEVERICLMFDHCIVVNRGIAIYHDYCETEVGIKMHDKEDEMN